MAANRYRMLAGASSVVVAVIVVTWAPLEAQVRAPQDPVREAALAHLATVLFPADSDPARPHCIGVHAEDLEGPPSRAGDDPSTELLAALRVFVPHAVPRSACEPGSPLVLSAAGVGVVDRPISYHVGLVRTAGNTATATVSYLIGEERGGGWTCELARRGRAWVVRDCLPLWLS